MIEGWALLMVTGVWMIVVYSGYRFYTKVIKKKKVQEGDKA